jgi:peptidylprolyl isomerase
MLDINLNEFTDLRFDAGGVLAMANNGPATNSSHFLLHTSLPMVRR